MTHPRILVVFLLFMFGCCSCKQQPEKPPLPENKMQQVLLDIHLAETYSIGLGADSTRNRFDKNYDSLAVFYTSILKHHGLSFEQFNEALNWYRERPQAIDSLYTKVLNQLNELKAKEGIKDAEETPQPPPSAPAPSVQAAPDTTKTGKQGGLRQAIVPPKPKTDAEP